MRVSNNLESDQAQHFVGLGLDPDCLLLSPASRRPRGGGGGGTLIFSHIHRLGPFFWVQNSEFQYFWGFQKNEYFLGY